MGNDAKLFPLNGLVLNLKATLFTFTLWKILRNRYCHLYPQILGSNCCHTAVIYPRTYVSSPFTFAEDPDRYRENGLHPLW